MAEEGNTASMREALEAFVQLVDDGMIKPRAMGHQDEHCFVVVQGMARAALRAPTRNCDVGTADEQAERYRNFTDRYNPCAYRGYARCSEDCPVHVKLTQEGHGELQCQLEWAQMPYEEEK